MPVAELRAVTKNCGDVRALRGIDLRMERGELLALLGPNGAGKTTAVRILLGLNQPTTGTASIFGHDPASQAAKLQRGALLQVARVPETLRVRELIELFSSCREALDLAVRQLPDILLTDIEMPELTGLEVAAEIKRRRLPVRVVILTTFARAGYLRRALDAGVSGYLLKDAPSSTLADAIRRIKAGARVIDPELAAEAWTDADPLTDRERQVLRHAGEGAASAEIAQRLNLSEGTVRNYLSEAISKTGASNRTEAARIARQKGWL